MALGSIELLFLVLLGGGRPDLLSAVDAGDYFKSRNIAAETAAQLTSPAHAETKTPKDDVARLLAIRTLGERREASARATLENIAGGPEGFAKDYAGTALAALDGKPAPAPPPMPADSVRSGGLEWFPADVDFFAALDFRGAPAGGDPAARGKALRAAFGKLPPGARETAYEFLDAVGNIRIDRLSFAFGSQPEEQRGRIMIRFTGRADRAALIKFLTAKNAEFKTVEHNDAGAVVLTAENSPPAFVFVGDSDLLVVGYERNNADHSTVAAQVLVTKAGKGLSVATGAFSKDLKALQPGAFAVFMGVVPEEVRKELSHSPLGLAPQNFGLHAVGDGQGGVAVHGRAETENADDAKQLAANLEALRKQGLEALANLPAGFPAKIGAGLRKVLEGAAVKADGIAVTGTLTVGSDLLASLGELAEFLQGPRDRPQPPQE
jgi:hypothetical protein